MRTPCKKCSGWGTIRKKNKWFKRKTCPKCLGDGEAHCPGWPDEAEIRRLRPDPPLPPPEEGETADDYRYRLTLTRDFQPIKVGDTVWTTKQRWRSNLRWESHVVAKVFKKKVEYLEPCERGYIGAKLDIIYKEKVC